MDLLVEPAYCSTSIIAWVLNVEARIYSNSITVMKRNVCILFFILFVTSFHVAHAQVIAMTVMAIAKSLQPADKKLMTNIKGEWIVQEARINNKEVLNEFEGVVINFPKCKGKAYKEGSCQVIEVTGDDKTDYFKQLFAEESKASITSRKEINKASKAEDADFEKVKYELVLVKGVEHEFSFKYKKKELRIETIGDGHSEFFLLVRPPKKKKKRS